MRTSSVLRLQRISIMKMIKSDARTDQFVATTVTRRTPLRTENFAVRLSFNFFHGACISEAVISADGERSLFQNEMKYVIWPYL